MGKVRVRVKKKPNPPPRQSRPVEDDRAGLNRTLGLKQAPPKAKGKP